MSSETATLIPWETLPRLGLQPRQWQVEALPLALAAIDAGERTVISAVMGSGKSIILAELLRLRQPPPGYINVVTTPTQALVRQLTATIASIFADEGGRTVGQFYTHAKQIAPVTVTCNASAVRLAAALIACGLRVNLWIGDEAHRTESMQIIDAAKALEPRFALGCTATAFRASRKQTLSLWDREVFKYTVADALRDKVIVMPNVHHWTRETAQLDFVCVEMIKDFIASGPGLVNAKSIADAEHFSKVLKNTGITATVVHSRMSAAKQADQIELVRRGVCAVLVHVNLLTEGVDYPWLRWLCMRREVESSVRFCQEVGRVIRASPGKTHADILDPHDLFNKFDLTVDSMLGLACESEDEDEDDKEDEERELQDLDESEPRIIKMHAARSYVRKLRLQLEFVGAIRAPDMEFARFWRWKPPTEDQDHTLGQVKVKDLEENEAIPLIDRNLLQKVIRNRAVLLRGDAHDLITITQMIADRRRKGQPWPITPENRPTIKAHLQLNPPAAKEVP